MATTSSASSAPSTLPTTTAAAAAAGIYKPTTSKNDAMGKDAFMKLLVAQLKYQNPLSPMDGTQFIAQTAQLTMTEKLEELSSLQQTAALDTARRSAADLVGRTITYDDGQNVVEGVVTSARMNAGNPMLLIGKTEVPLGSVLEVRATQPAASASTSATTASTPTSTSAPASSTVATSSSPATTTATTSTASAA